MPVCNSKDPNVKHNSDDDREDDSYPDLHVRPDSVTPFCFLQEANTTFIKILSLTTCSTNMVIKDRKIEER